ncbi:hypothetical protein [Methanobrevibacter olleyae]|uniref:Uncharacterized protein n=1 Tax=Methanobrevibacter olleyae TaxID=294671 RepID=A0A126QZS6_METOL|nr:hypothetical protein [Methanobrevibacter olleyae]AMK15334.1 hypothetical protein YLM1_0777 [Methanobrevibacter olleyae]SFL30213.1 hypothetical protein SAMN02910297_00520 [Methanobrevibacter olleyae]
MKVVAIGADISNNDVSVSSSLVENIEKDIPKLLELGAKKAALTNITGDDVVISAFVEDELLETINGGIVEILKDNAEDSGDLDGISTNPDDAGEGISYAEANLEDGPYQDVIIMAFDTYGGESFVEDVANSAIEAASGMKDVIDVSDKIGSRRDIPGVGYVSNDTDDPVVVVSVSELEQISVVASAMIGAVLGNKNTYLVKRHTPCNVLPGSVLVSVTALMNGNMIDLSIPFENKTRILG